MQARVPDQVMQYINEYLLEEKRISRPWHYWICQNKRGQFAEVMKDLVERKIQYKEKGFKAEGESSKNISEQWIRMFW